jgi:hypothetical protein
MQKLVEINGEVKKAGKAREMPCEMMRELCA